MAFANCRFGSSGLARTIRASALARPTAARRAFQPIRSNLAPALGARFASGVGDGKIHQVIGAVVDGMQSASAKACALELASEYARCDH